MAGCGVYAEFASGSALATICAFPHLAEARGETQARDTHPVPHGDLPPRVA